MADDWQDTAAYVDGDLFVTSWAAGSDWGRLVPPVRSFSVETRAWVAYERVALVVVLPSCRLSGIIGP